MSPPTGIPRVPSVHRFAASSSDNVTRIRRCAKGGGQRLSPTLEHKRDTVAGDSVSTSAGNAGSVDGGAAVVTPINAANEPFWEK